MQHQDSTGLANGTNLGGPAAEEYITLSQAAKLAPGRPSANCVWRWCRQGVRAASGKRVRLEHVRFGSRIYTSRRWLNAFGLALAEADAVHFDRDERSPVSEPSRRASTRSRRGSRSTGGDEARRRHLEAERELDEAGL